MNMFELIKRNYTIVGEHGQASIISHYTNEISSVDKAIITIKLGQK